MICKRYAVLQDGNFSTRAEDGNLYIEGYFAVYNSRYELWDEAYETIDRGAFDGETDGDVRALTNHDTTLVLGLSLIHIFPPQVEHGRWKTINGKGCFTGGGNPLWGCSKCRHIIGAMLLPPKYNYCPNCGAKMDGGKDDG